MMDGSNDVAQNKGFGILAYLGFLCLVPLLAAKESPFARFHTGQGLTLFVIEVVLGAASWLLGFIPFIGWLFQLALGLVGLGCFVLSIIGIINAAEGRTTPLPIVGAYSLLK